MPNYGETRRESVARGKGFSAGPGYCSGVTFIEILIVVAIAIIMAAYMMPMSPSRNQEQQLIDGASAISEFLAEARLEANIQQQPIAVNYERYSRTDWCVGYAEGDQGCSCTVSKAEHPDACLVNGSLKILQSAALEDPDILKGLAGDGMYVFYPARDFAYDAAGRRIFDEAELELESTDQNYALNVQISSTGNITACNEPGHKPLDGFRECLHNIR